MPKRTKRVRAISSKLSDRNLLTPILLRSLSLSLSPAARNDSNGRVPRASGKPRVSRENREAGSEERRDADEFVMMDRGEKR